MTIKCVGLKHPYEASEEHKSHFSYALTEAGPKAAWESIEMYKLGFWLLVQTHEPTSKSAETFLWGSCRRWVQDQWGVHSPFDQFSKVNVLSHQSRLSNEIIKICKFNCGVSWRVWTEGIFTLTSELKVPKDEHNLVHVVSGFFSSCLFFCVISCI